MRTVVLVFAIALVQAAAVQAPAPATVYLVTRARSAEARAMLSARLVQMHASKLHWYSENGVVRAEVDKDLMTKLDADPDVVLVIGDAAAQELELPPTLPAPSF